MSDDKQVNKSRRNLVIATCCCGRRRRLWPRLCRLRQAGCLPSAPRLAARRFVADISTLEPGQIMTVEWRSKPVWIVRRTKEMLDGLAHVDGKVSDPNPTCRCSRSTRKTNTVRIKPEVLVLVGICTHLGCSPQSKTAEDKTEMGADWSGGFLCPCHGSKFDLAGRVYKGAPAPVNLEVPKYTYLSDTRILIGEDKQGA